MEGKDYKSHNHQSLFSMLLLETLPGYFFPIFKVVVNFRVRFLLCGLIFSTSSGFFFALFRE
jgi:hypothetical protein